MTSYYRIAFKAATNADLRHTFCLKDSTGAAIDLGGASLAMDMRDKDGDDVLACTLANGRITIPAPQAGQFALAVAASDLSAIPPGVYQHDLLLTRQNSVERIWTGTITLEQGVTR
jgi:hypothetical protein